MELLDLPINELKRQLINSQDFGAIMTFFFDRFVDEPSFMAASTETRVPDVMAEAASQTFASIRETSIVVSSWAIGEVALFNLIHGSILTSDGGRAVILWAMDIGIGLVGIPDKATCNIVYARFKTSTAKAVRAN